jgi:hypothetical protein
MNWWTAVDEELARDRQSRLAWNKPLKAPPRCASCCHDEEDCSNVYVCRALAEAAGEPTI